MPSHKDLLKLIREGRPPEEIHRLLKMRPSHWRRMLCGKRFQDALRTHEDLAAVLAVHRIASGVDGVAGRFTELLESPNTETVRKVCLALLNEGLQAGCSHRDPAPRQQQVDPSCQTEPWTLLRPMNPPARAVDPAEI